MDNYFYELGKWRGDRRGYPRVGLINTEKTLVDDTKRFLERFNKPITYRKITKKDCKTMYGESAFEVFIVDSKLHKKLEKESMNFLSLKKSDWEKDLSFLGGFIDADGTIDLKNQQVVLSVGHKNYKVKEGIVNLIKRLNFPLRIWNCQKEWKLSIKSTKEVINKLKECVKHSKKKALLNNEISVSDKKYLKFIKSNNGITSKELADEFKIHIDSARRVLRYFHSIKLVKKDCNTSSGPYQYS